MHEDDIEHMQDTSQQTLQKPFTDIPPVSTKPDHAAATARIYVHGLSVLCPSRNKQAVEIAFVDAMHSRVLIEVFDKVGRPVPGGRYECPANRRVRINLKKTNPRSIGYQVDDTVDAVESLSAMPDLTTAAWHNYPAIQMSQKASEKLSAKLVIKDGVFYTAARSVSDATRTKKKNGSSVPPPPDIPKLGRVLGADITCDQNDAGLTIDVIGWDSTQLEEEELNRISLPKAGGQYMISISTKAAHEHDTLYMLYDDILNKPNGEEFTMKYQAKEAVWLCCGFIGDKTSVPKNAYVNYTPEADAVIDGNREVFHTEGDAVNAGYSVVKPDASILSTEYACQAYGGGPGPLPDFPPEGG